MLAPKNMRSLVMSLFLFQSVFSTSSFFFLLHVNEILIWAHTDQYLLPYFLSCVSRSAIASAIGEAFNALSADPLLVCVKFCCLNSSEPSEALMLCWYDVVLG